MQRHLLAFLRPLVRVLLPALVFFLTGAAAVYRQSYGFQKEREMLEAEEEHALLVAMSADLQQEIVHLQSRSRVTEIARGSFQLQQPSGDQIVILQVQTRPEAEEHPKQHRYPWGKIARALIR